MLHVAERPYTRRLYSVLAFPFLHRSQAVPVPKLAEMRTLALCGVYLAPRRPALRRQVDLRQVDALLCDSKLRCARLCEVPLRRLVRAAPHQLDTPGALAGTPIKFLPCVGSPLAGTPSPRRRVRTDPAGCSRYRDRGYILPDVHAGSTWLVFTASRCCAMNHQTADKVGNLLNR